jgi:hypothetical protein
METKAFIGAVKTASASGAGSLVVATLHTVDKDGDVTLPGYFGRQTAMMVPAHDWTHVPIGKGVVYERGDEAIVDFQLNMDIEAARDWHAAIKFDLDNPPALQEYSYGFTIKAGGSRQGDFGGRPVRFLQPLSDGSPGVTVFEISPCLRGAGVRTRTLNIDGATDPKAALQREYLNYIASRHGIRIENPKVTLERIYRRQFGSRPTGNGTR